jgi:DNA-binding response OmpR family regulator
MANRILLVDDEPQLLFSVREYLSRLGYDVVPAENGTEALQLLVEAPPDLIISDVMMDEMDGFDFQRRTTALTGDSVPFIFLTAKGGLQSRLDGLRNGADDYVTKPFEPQELEARVAAVLHRVDQVRQEERRELDNLRARILSQISMQLRTPMNSLMAHLNMMLTRHFGSNELEKERFLKSALKDAQVLAELIGELSWVDGEDAAQITVSKEPIRIAPVVRAASASAARVANEKGIDLRIACGGLLSGNVDASLIERALSGLLESAVQVSPAGGSVEISASRAAEGGIEFAITDGGCEVTAGLETHQDMADALDYAQRVVRAHGGQLTTQRSEQGAQRFVIWVPGRVAKHVGKKR